MGGISRSGTCLQSYNPSSNATPRHQKEEIPYASKASLASFALPGHQEVRNAASASTASDHVGTSSSLALDESLATTMTMTMPRMTSSASHISSSDNDGKS